MRPSSKTQILQAAARAAEAVVAEGLVMTYRSRTGTVRAPDGLDLRVPGRAGVLGLLGPNPPGKTTTVRILATLLRPVVPPTLPWLAWTSCDRRNRCAC